MKATISLRRRLLAWLFIPLILMAAALVGEAYFSSRKSVEDIHDRMMVALAWSISEYAVGSGGDLVPEKALELVSESSNARLYYLVTGPGGAFITGHDSLPASKAKYEDGTPHFYDAFYNNEPVRMLAMRFLVEGRDIDGWMEVRVAQTRNDRDALVKEAVIRSASRVAIVIILASLLAIFAVTAGLAPLVNLQNAIQRRSYDDLRPISQNMPKEVHQVVTALNSLLGRLSDSVETQRRFIANASHQLRTPLAALQAEAELALRDVKDPSTQESLEEIRRGTRHASRLANQLLSLTRVRSNPGGGASRSLFDLVKVAQDVTTESVRRSINEGIDLGFESELSELELEGSEFQIHEMLTNLVDNSLRYGGQEITVRVAREQNKAILEVEDNGPGIPTEKRELVFERFVRLDERAGEGCGLGLDIVREIVEGHGGQIELQDGPGQKGIRTHITFPIENTQ